MRKNTLSALAVIWALALCSPAVVWGQSLADPAAMTPKGQFALGLDVSYLFEQKTADFDLRSDDSNGDSGYSTNSGKIKNDQCYLLSLGYGVTDWLNVFAQAGVVNGGKLIETNRYYPEDWEIKLRSQFVWGVGAKARAFQLDNGLALGLAARYLRYDNRKMVDWRDNVTGRSADQNWSTDEELDYWQADLAATLSMPFGPVTPYVGLGYSYFEAKESGRWTSKSDPSYYANYDAKMKSDNELLALCGLDVALGHGLSLYAQAEFVARTTVGLGLNWSF